MASSNPQDQSQQAPDTGNQTLGNTLGIVVCNWLSEGKRLAIGIHGADVKNPDTRAEIYPHEGCRTKSSIDLGTKESATFRITIYSHHDPYRDGGYWSLIGDRFHTVSFKTVAGPRLIKNTDEPDLSRQKIGFWYTEVEPKPEPIPIPTPDDSPVDFENSIPMNTQVQTSDGTEIDYYFELGYIDNAHWSTAN